MINRRLKIWSHEDSLQLEGFYQHRLCFKGSSGGSSTSTVQKSDPWAGQQPYLTYGFEEAKKQYLKEPSQYQGQTLAPLTADTLASMEMVRKRATEGSPLSRDTNRLVADTIAGKYLYGGDAFNAALDAARRNVLPSVDSAYAKAGRYGSGLAQTAQTQALADVFAGQYAQERANQMQAAGMSLDLAQQDYNDAQMLAKVGEIQSAQDQAVLDDAFEKYKAYENAKADQLTKYMALIQGNFGSTQTTTPPSRNAALGALGGAMYGASAGKYATNSNYGAGAGALIGGYLGSRG